MAEIALNSIKKTFGPTRVLNGIDLTVADGEFLTLVGPSGCGKSTLLRIIAGLELQTSGDVIINGRVVNRVRPSERDLAMVFQNYALYPHLSVEENMLTPLRLRDLSRVERFPIVGPFVPGRRAKMAALRSQVRDTAKILEIEPLLGRKPGQLSGGQRQRAALGRAMVRKPVAFLMDEPLSNLDAALRVHMRSELAELHRALATTFIYVTHDQAEALTMSDRMAVMMGGNILQLAPPDEIYTNPNDLRVAKFVGSPKINTLPGRADGRGVVSVFGMPLTRPVDARNADVTVAIRPEHLAVATGPAEETFAARVVHKENLGSDIYLHATVGDGAARIIVRVDPNHAASVSIGNAIAVRRERGEAMVFAADNRRLPFHKTASLAA